MRCEQCHHENREGRRFCAECGAPLAVSCPGCGFSNTPGETRFALVINLKTAKALGLTILQSVLIPADQVIQ